MINRRKFIRNIALAVAASSMMPDIAVNKAFAVASEDPEVSAIIKRMGPLKALEKRTIAQFIRNLKKDGTWDKLDVFYPMWDNPNAPELKTWAIDWKNPDKDVTIQDLCEAGVDFKVGNDEL